MNDIAVDTEHFPGSDWDVVAPESLGIDPQRLAGATEEIFTIDKRYGFLVAKNGRIVHEHYLRDASATNPIYSVTKGFGATLIGIAQQQGILHVDDPVSEWLPVHHPDITDDATIKHLLNMTAGRSPAGSWWQYNSNEILNSLTGILWLAAGIPPVEFYEKYLRAPLNLSFEWPSNSKGWVRLAVRDRCPLSRQPTAILHAWVCSGFAAATGAANRWWMRHSFRTV
ncbi:MAG: beta-lactamase family protein [Pseudomonadales bacterium]|nr:beta-lactamase family protein [Pseudomonadales bacterium]